MSYKIEIIRDLCIGDQQCCNVANKTFEMDADNIAVVCQCPGDTPEDILEAAKTCPTDAIVLKDESGKQIWPET